MALQRKHEAFERDLAALGDGVASLTEDARRVASAFPERADNVRERDEAVSVQWDALTGQAAQRKAKLDDAKDLQRFLNDIRTSLSWISDMKALVSADELAKDVAGADALLQRHQEHRDEIQARQESFASATDFGNSLVLRGHYATDELQEKLDQLRDEREALDQLWQDRQKVFEESHQLQVFLRDVEQLETWVAARESALAGAETGDSLDAVEALLKKHDDFEKSLAAQEEKTRALQEQAKRLAQDSHSDAATITQRCDAAVARRTELDRMAADRRTHLQDAQRLEEFKRDADEAEAWMDEKLQTAADESYVDPSNLRGKVKNHEAFAAELRANETRLTAMHTAGKRLQDDKHYAAAEVADRLAHLDAQWADLVARSDDKGQKLREAQQQQEFNRRVDDIESWCKETEAALADDDLGKDLLSAQNLLKKHQLLETDVAGHRDRIDTISAQAGSMIAEGNFQAGAIRERRDALTARYKAFAAPLQERRDKLEASVRLQQFLRNVDDEASWIQEKTPVAASTNYGGSLAAVQNLQKKHNALQAELEGREKAIAAVEGAAKALRDERHYATDVVEQRQRELLEHWRMLCAQADVRRVALDEALRVQQYIADANEAEAWMAEKEPIVANDSYGKDEDGAMALLKKHEAVEADLQSFRNTIDTLRADSHKCKEDATAGGAAGAGAAGATGQLRVQAKHKFDGDGKRRLSVDKGEILELVGKETADWWRVKNDAGASGFVPASYLTEVSATSPGASASSSPSKRASASEGTSVAARQGVVETQYERLLQLAAARRARLVETQQLFQLGREVDEVESWMNTREAVASVPDTGNDLEHNELLQKKFDDFLKDLSANESRVVVANSLADQLLEGGHSDAEAIKARRQALNDRWASLLALSKTRSAELAAAHNVHRFNRDADETLARFAEKDVILSNEDYGKDVASVEALQRKHEGAMRDLQALEQKVAELRGAAAGLTQAQPAQAPAVNGKFQEIETEWAQLQAKADARKRALAAALRLQQFLSEYRDLASWAASMQTLASADELAKDASGAEALLKRHQDLQTEIDARGDAVQAFRDFGKELVASDGGAEHAAEVGAKVAATDDALQALAEAMAVRKLRLQQCYEQQAFNRIAEQTEAWIAAREVPLANEDVGSTLDAVEAMQKKHADFEKSLAAQREKLTEVETEADRLVAAQHYDASAIAARKRAVLDRWAALVELADARKARLERAMQVQQFNRDADEAEAWMAEKAQVAADPSYKDPANLAGKLQKHQAFEAEVTANEGRIFAVMDTGRQVMRDAPDSAPVVQTRIDSLDEQWAALCSRAANKAQKLREAAEQQQYNQGVEDLEFWLGEVELQLASQGYGKDLPGVQSLLKKHELVEADIGAHEERVTAVEKQARAFAAAGHFDADSIQARQREIAERYAAVQALAAERQTKLQESLRLQQVLRDIDDEEAWIAEKERVAASTDFGKDLTGVQNLQKKHLAFDAELGSHDARISAVVAAAQDLVRQGHYAADELERRRGGLVDRWDHLRDASQARRQRLEEALQFQLFLADADEEESWINEKQSMLSSEESPDTLSGAQALVKKHEAFETELHDHKGKVRTIAEQGHSLARGGNYQAEAIGACVSKLERQLAGLGAAADARKVKLGDRLHFLRFSREADSIEAWIEDKEPQVDPSDTGRDLAAVQALLAKQDTFDASVAAFHPRIEGFESLRQELLQQGNSNAAAVTARGNAVTERWQALLEAAAQRRRALTETQDTFQRIDDHFLEFAQKASQFNSWFENAEEDLTDPVRVNSLEEIQALRASHAEFMRSLEASQDRYQELVALDRRIKGYTTSKNPYTWFTVETLEESWANLRVVIDERSEDLQHELKRQEDNEQLRKLFAQHANAFSGWLTSTRSVLVEGSGSLEAQLEATQARHEEIMRKKMALKAIEDLGARMEEQLILDNRYTEHSTVGLAQQWDQLEQLGMRMQHNLEQQIQAKNTTGVSEEQLKEFNDTFRYFDKDGSGRLDHQELKSCLRSLGYSLPVVEEGERDPEFEQILRQVDPNGDGYVNQSEFISFMISRETENVESASEVINAFRAAANGAPFLAAEDLHRVLTPEQADFCIRNMPPYVDETGKRIPNALDYRNFTTNIFAG
jgi:spectrin alpha